MATTPEAGGAPQPADLIDRLRPSPGRSHNLQPVEEILGQLHVGSIERLLLWLSKTDVYVLALSPYSNRQTLASLGMMVLFTTSLAFVSGFYALASSLIAPDSALRWPVAGGLALLYAFGIMIIDREIVGAASLKSMPLRLLFAVGIAIAVSYPVKLKFFEGRITNEISRMIDERNADKLRRIDELKKTGEPERQQQRATILGRVASIDREVAVLDGEIQREASDVRCDAKCQAFRRQKSALLAQRQVAERELAELGSRAQLAAHLQREVDKLEGEVEGERRISYDFLHKWEAVERIKADPKSDYETISWFLLGFFILLELVPLGLKLSLGKSEYNLYIESRTHLNKQKIVAINNVFISAMQRDPMLALEILPMEITDLMAAHMEDESLGMSNQPTIDGLVSALRRHTAHPREPAAVPPPAQPAQAPSRPGFDPRTTDEPPPPGRA